MLEQIARLINVSIRLRKQIYVLLAVLPIVFLGSSFTLLEWSGDAAFFMVVLLLSYAIAAVSLCLSISNKRATQRDARSPFYFIKRLHTTGAKIYWDEYQKSTRYLIGAEIGVYRGDNAKRILDFLNIRQLVLVDPWKGYNRASGVELAAYPDAEENMGDSFYENLYKVVEDRFAGSTNVTMVRETSVNAAKLFDEEYFDFIYIDGDHRYQAVLDDLKAWYPKLKRYGVMCGDDYGHPSGVGVIKAVSEFAYEHGLIVGYGEDNQFWFVKIA